MAAANWREGSGSGGDREGRVEGTAGTVCAQLKSALSCAGSHTRTQRYFCSNQRGDPALSSFLYCENPLLVLPFYIISHFFHSVSSICHTFYKSYSVMTVRLLLRLNFQLSTICIGNLGILGGVRMLFQNKSSEAVSHSQKSAVEGEKRFNSLDYIPNPVRVELKIYGFSRQVTPYSFVSGESFVSLSAAKELAWYF